MLKRLLLSSIVLSLGTLALAQDGTVIDAAVVSAKGSGLTMDKGKITLDVAGDSLLRELPLKDILQRLPLVRVDPLGKSVSVQTGSFAITVNGRRSLILEDGNLDYVSELLRGRNLSSVSLNTAPTGRYASYSAVLDIRTDEDLMDFISGRLDADWADGEGADAAVRATTKLGRTIASVHYSPSYRDARRSMESSVRESLTDPSAVYEAYDTLTKDTALGHALTLRSSYDIGSKDVLFLDAGYGHSDAEQESRSYFYPDAAVSSLDAVTDNWSAGLAWQRDFAGGGKKLLTVQAGFAGGKTSNVTDIDGMLADNVTRSFESGINADFSHRLSPAFNYYMRAGYKYRHYASESAGLSLLDYPQKIASVEGNVSYSPGRIRMSARMSYDRTEDIRRYGNISCNASVDWFASSSSRFRVAYSRSIFRPDLDWLNNYADSSKAGTVVQGNGAIKSQVSNNAVFVYRYMRGMKLSFNAMIARNWSDDGAYGRVTVSDDGSILSSYANSGKMRSWRASTGAIWRPTGSLSLELSPGCAWYRYDWDGEPVRSFDFFVHFVLDADLWEGAELSVNTTWCNPDMAKTVDAQATRFHNILRGAVGISQELGDFDLYLSMDRPWQKYRKDVREIEASGYKVLTTAMTPISRVEIGVIYTFGRFGGRVKSNARQIDFGTDRHKTN